MVAPELTLVSFGESHSDLYTGRCQRFSPGPLTMHRIGRDGLAALLGMMPQMPPGAGPHTAWLFVFGEIDLRCHFGPQVHHHGRAIQDIISTVVEAYLNVLAAFQTGTRVAAVAVRGVVAPLPNEWHHDDTYPIRATFEERRAWRLVLNEALKAGCLLRRFVYVPPPAWSERPDGTMRHEVSDTCIHVQPTPEHVERAESEFVNLLAQHLTHLTPTKTHATTPTSPGTAASGTSRV